uniref:Uncharacterized protein n=1 Tax=Meloidogyne enterolobii TaxID=390850 RepID=A0A6V7VFS6_MELEN|nr:unnamed protein product [Meloidogyne enterolobii]
MKNNFYFIIIFVNFLILNNIFANNDNKEININLPVTIKKFPLNFKYGPSNKTIIVSEVDVSKGNVFERKN